MNRLSCFIVQTFQNVITFNPQCKEKQKCNKGNVIYILKKTEVR